MTLPVRPNADGRFWERLRGAVGTLLALIIMLMAGPALAQYSYTPFNAPSGGEATHAEILSMSYGGTFVADGLNFHNQYGIWAYRVWDSNLGDETVHVVTGDQSHVDQVWTDGAATVVAIARYADFDRPLYKCGDEGTFTMTVNGNWKLAIENGAESYHLPWVHPGLNSYSRLKDHYHLDADGPFCGQGTTVYSPMLTEDGRRFPAFGGQDNPLVAGLFAFSLCNSIEGLVAAVQQCFASQASVDSMRHDREREISEYLDLGEKLSSSLEGKRRIEEVVEIVLQFHSSEAVG